MTASGRPPLVNKAETKTLVSITTRIIVRGAGRAHAVQRQFPRRAAELMASGAPVVLATMSCQHRRASLLTGLQDSFQQRRARGQLPARDRMDRLHDRGVYGSGNAELRSDAYDISVDEVDLGNAPALDILQHRGSHITVAFEYPIKPGIVLFARLAAPGPGWR